MCYQVRPPGKKKEKTPNCSLTSRHDLIRLEDGSDAAVLDFGQLYGAQGPAAPSPDKQVRCGSFLKYVMYVYYGWTSLDHLYGHVLCISTT